MHFYCNLCKAITLRDAKCKKKKSAEPVAFFQRKKSHAALKCRKRSQVTNGMDLKKKTSPPSKRNESAAICMLN